ncbi:MAG: hypothetical protein ACM33U_09095 [Solirubrobacterales bacterium]|nr:hypothetical protein [Solirubrobacterales bacterium]
MAVIYRHKTAGHQIVRSRISPKLEASPRWERLGASPAPAPRQEGSACPECDFVAKNPNGLRLHRKAKHPDTEEA